MIDDDDMVAKVCTLVLGVDWRTAIPYGAMVGSAVLGSCLKAESVRTTYADRECGDFSPGRFAWELREPVACAPLP